MAVSWMVLIMRSLRWCRGEYLEGDDDAVEVADYDDDEGGGDDDGADDCEVFEKMVGRVSWRYNCQSSQ